MDVMKEILTEDCVICGHEVDWTYIEYRSDFHPNSISRQVSACEVHVLSCLADLSSKRSNFVKGRWTIITFNSLLPSTKLCGETY